MARKAMVVQGVDVGSLQLQFTVVVPYCTIHGGERRRGGGYVRVVSGFVAVVFFVFFW